MELLQMSGVLLRVEDEQVIQLKSAQNIPANLSVAMPIGKQSTDSVINATEVFDILCSWYGLLTSRYRSLLRKDLPCLTDLHFDIVIPKLFT